MKIKFIFVAVIAIFFSSCASIPEPSQEKLVGAKPYPLDVCLVIERPLKDTKRTYTKVYKGQVVKFCCKNCIKAFELNPEPFMAKLK